VGLEPLAIFARQVVSCFLKQICDPPLGGVGHFWHREPAAPPGSCYHFQPVYRLISNKVRSAHLLTILPRRGRSNRLVPDAHGPQSHHEDGGIQTFVGEQFHKNLNQRLS
jgi:hypothetical protein